MSSEEKTPETWGPRVQLKSPPYPFPTSLDFPAPPPPPPSGRRLLIMTVGAVTVLAISVLGVLLATYLGRAHCSQRDVSPFLPPQLNVQNEASLLLAFSELSDQGSAPGITCDLKNKNITLGLSLDVQVVGVGSLGSLVTLLCNNKPIYLVTTLPAPSRGHTSLPA
ncbi:uncharacterized protein LOC143942530 isoform X3 [Lithobates pipiens]